MAVIPVSVGADGRVLTFRTEPGGPVFDNEPVVAHGPAASITPSRTTANTAKPNDGLSVVAASVLQGAGTAASGVLGGVAQVTNSSAAVPLLLVGGGVALGPPQGALAGAQRA